MLTGQAKRDYQRDYMRKRRASVRPTLDPVRPTRSELQSMIHKMEAEQPKEIKEEFIPWYNPQRHKTGDKVKIYDASGQMQIVIVPELDADGHAIGE